MAASLIRPLGSFASASLHSFYSNLNIIEKPNQNPSHFTHFATKMSTGVTNSKTKIIDSHLHVWASPQEAAEKYPYFPGQEPTLPGHVDLLLQCMEEAGVDGALIVQPINHKFDHSLVTRQCFEEVPSQVRRMLSCRSSRRWKWVDTVLFASPYLWPPNEQMTNDIGKAMFSKAGELGVPVGFMCMKGLNLHIKAIEELCSNYPSTTVLLDHLAFCKPPTTHEETLAFSNLLKLSRFPQVYVKFSALFRVSREKFPYKDLTSMLSKLVSSFGANRVMWGSDFPFVVPECGYNEAKQAASLIAHQASLSSEELEWIMGGTIMELFKVQWRS